MIFYAIIEKAIQKYALHQSGFPQRSETGNLLFDTYQSGEVSLSVHHKPEVMTEGTQMTDTRLIKSKIMVAAKSDDVVSSIISPKLEVTSRSSDKMSKMFYQKLIYMVLF